VEGNFLAFEMMDDLPMLSREMGPSNCKDRAVFSLIDKQSVKRKWVIACTVISIFVKL